MNIALVLSGGTGTRIGTDIPKQYIKTGDKMIISFCLDMFTRHERTDAVWIVAAPEWQQVIRDEYERSCPGCGKLRGFSLPGKTRQLSILNGLRDISAHFEPAPAGEDHIVIIHDAARPNLTTGYVDNCLDAIKGHDGVMPVLPMKDTVYYSNDGKCVDKLLDRARIFAGQAPELYLLGKYLEANERLLPDEILKINGSTEPAVLAGLSVAMIPGDESNYKITTKRDLERFMHEGNGL